MLSKSPKKSPSILKIPQITSSGNTRDHSDKFSSGPTTNRAKFINLLSTFRRDEESRHGSEVLRSLHFALNPQIHYKRKKPKSLQGPIIDQLKAQISDISKANKNLLALKARKKVSKNLSMASFALKPKLRQSHNIVGGTLSLLMNESSNMKLPNLNKSGNEFIKPKEYDISEKAREKLRVEIVNYLLTNKKEIVTKINQSQQIMISWVLYLNYINRSEFDELLMAIGVPYDESLYYSLFRVFDINDNGVVDQKEVITALELFQEHSFEEKLKMFFELADEDGRGFLDEEKLVKFFKKNLTLDEEIKKVKPAVNILVNQELYLQVKGRITLEDLDHGCQTNEALKAVIEANVTEVKKSKKSKPKLSSSNFMSGQMDHGQDGFSLPYMQRIVDAFEEKATIAHKHTLIKKQFDKSFKYLKEVGGMRDANE